MQTAESLFGDMFSAKTEAGPSRAQTHWANTEFSPVVECIEQAIKDGATPGAVLLVAQGGRVHFQEAFGSRTPRSAKFPDPQPMNVETVFDIASVTGSVITTTLVMKLVEAGMFSLDDRVCRYAQSFGVLGKSGITIGHLLNHSSSLPAWMPFFEDLLRENAGARRGIITSRGARDYVFQAINRLQVKPAAIGTKQVYSDLGMMLLGHLIEQLTGVGLEKAAHRLVFQPLGMKSTSFVDLSMIKRRGIHPVTDLIAPTEDCPWRERVLCGEVHDDNAWAMGGIAGHSGIFSTVHDLHLLCRELLRSERGESEFLAAPIVRMFWKGAGEYAEGWRYGWDSASRENGVAEIGFSNHAVGHHGFTGCSVWIDPGLDLEIILLSNRVCPSRNNKKFLAVRPEIHKRILSALEKASLEKAGHEKGAQYVG